MIETNPGLIVALAAVLVGIRLGWRWWRQRARSARDDVVQRASTGETIAT